MTKKFITPFDNKSLTTHCCRSTDTFMPLLLGFTFSALQ